MSGARGDLAPGLLGGAYREGEPKDPPPAPTPAAPAEQEEHSARSLDSVFNRLAGGLPPSAPDPRDRLKHILAKNSTSWPTALR